MIPSEVIERVRERIDVVSHIGQRVPLRKSGSSFVGSCPFHDDREPSFRVYPVEKRFVCFGCGARGDVFEFLQKLDRKPFPTVVRELASSVGVECGAERSTSPAEQSAKEERRMLLAACEAAAAHWEAQLWGPTGAAARVYLAQRGVTPECARAFRLGFAPDSWHELHRHLASMGFTEEVQLTAGLLAVKEGSAEKGRCFDRFRGRVMLPVRDVGGRVIGFGGRSVEGDHGAKYLNGPETALFKKARTLFGIDRAAADLRRDRALLVEGFFDAIALHQAGFTSAVATCGTSVAEEQLEALTRLGCGTVVLLFDGDVAGAAAPARNARVLLASGLSAFVARLGAHGTDPDDFLRRRGKSALEQVLGAAVPLTEHLIDEAVRAFAGGAHAHAAMEHKLRVVRELAPHVAAVPEGLARIAFEKGIARRLQLDLRPLRSELLGAVRSPARRRAS